MLKKIGRILPFMFLGACSTGNEHSDGVCPGGHTDSIIPIVYGLPTRETMERAERGEVKLGGCDMDRSDTRFHCKIHNLEF